jgi:hypothetical protein
MIIDLKIAEHSYFYGFAQADGSLYETTRNRGKLSIELSERDESLLLEFQNIFPVKSHISKRTRDTNFKDNHTSVTFTIHDWDFRKELKVLGFPNKSKSLIIGPPNGEYSEIDYIRGIIDGDGSLGLTSKDIPFLSLVTVSESLKDYYINFLFNITGKLKKPSRNKRDDAYNIMINKEDAKLVVSKLYYNDCFCLPRKLEKSKDVMSWVRPQNMKKITGRKKWTDEDDNTITTLSLEEAIKETGRTEQSIKMRLWRLSNSK